MLHVGLQNIPNECQLKVISFLHWFVSTVAEISCQKPMPLSQPMRNNTKTNHDLFARFFPCLTPLNTHEFALSSNNLVHCTVCVCCDWLE